MTDVTRRSVLLGLAAAPLAAATSGWAEQAAGKTANTLASKSRKAKMKITSPRGPITIDPETRDVVQTVYIRKVEKTGGGLYNVEFDKFPDQKDPGKT